MSDRSILEVKGVSQRFSRSMRNTLRYGVQDILHQFLPSGPERPRQLRDGEFWALSDVSFALKAGESAGILGNNGAGKSTLLKLIAGIYRPTIGSVRVKGRIGAIVELGSSFAPTLSGRENIRLQALLHGYGQNLLKQKLDEIIDFADLGDFIDSPVHHYSTGMRARLGFAVAVHGNPDLLLVDEVLAVGDQSFQNKCLRLVENFRAQGGAVVFVGHNPFQMQAACDRGIILHQGRMEFDGSIVHAIDRMLNGISLALSKVDDPSNTRGIPNFPTQRVAEGSYSNSFTVLTTNVSYHVPTLGQVQGSATIEFSMEVHRSPVRLNGLAAIFPKQGHQPIAVSISNAATLSSGMQTLVMHIPSLPLLSGNYLLKLSLLDECTSFSLWNMGWADRPVDFVIPGDGSPHGNIAKSISANVFIDSRIDVKKGSVQ